jgi:hypothetical protein
MIIRQINMSRVLGIIQFSKGRRYIFCCEGSFNTDIEDYFKLLGTKRNISFSTFSTMFWYQLELIKENNLMPLEKYGTT